MDKKTKKLLEKTGYFKAKKKHGKYRNSFPDLSVESKHALSNSFSNTCFKKSIDDYRWKKDIDEKTSEIIEIENKKKRITIGYNKGSYQYQSNPKDTLHYGK